MPSTPHKKSLPVSFLWTFSILLVLRLTSASFRVIDDCDEVYNYWEPLHYLLYGYGLQTWEYSPEYSIRSWFYVLLHAIPAAVAKSMGLSRLHVFYFVRGVMACFSAFCEATLVQAVARNFNRAVALHLTSILFVSSGIWVASTSFLPSSFAMNMVTLSLSAQLSLPSTRRTVKVLSFVVIGAILGWPFSAALSIPFVLLELMDIRRQFVPLITRWLKAGLVCLLITAICIAVDSFFYQKLEFVAWNIVKYNVFAKDGRGPEIYGTEPWWYYFANLTLQHNIAFWFALVCGPFVFIAALTNWINLDSFLDLSSVISPFYLWLLIFLLQPHKEERFMYPIYPVLCLAGAVGLDMFVKINMNLYTSVTRRARSTFPVRILVLIIYALMGFISIARILAVQNYNAPMIVYPALTYLEASENPITNICVGKEWYRYPSSFFLPEHARLKYVKSEFDGILPAEFKEDNTTSWWNRPGYFETPMYMNDLNNEEPTRYVSLEECDFLIDSEFIHSKPTGHELVYSKEPGWKVLFMFPFIDTKNTPFLGRALSVPFSEPKWGRYEVLSQKPVNVTLPQ
ncbi:mannosyltransferase complex subunit Alg9 [Schizosaccharomyces octosporus yFS286]|uniref:Mannosyltransferase n=1 Tax=Schizosaccharomyces octosporus (strain yFS286) TaxID=483514 RepID=S9PZ11_SCHOY|nr:mannosyltransferase complex subunit Alg9 [Schizosaccharomyces octosporus yFS286]EPX73212.1 mannosyltransferase complex subunit Alg9 [Schizosaccharomyces octosporus yFS286]